MTTELITTSHLAGPYISGTVTVPLAELDKMRADHAAAIKIASDLESKQAMVKIVFAQQYERYNHNEWGSRYFEGTYEVDQKIEYRGFEDFRARITKEETDRLRDQFESQEKRLTQSEERNLKATKIIEELKQKQNELQGVITEKNLELEEVSPFKEKYETLLGRFESQSQALRNLEKSHEALKQQKSLWATVKAKLGI